MHITSFHISTKKGDDQTLRFLIVQEIPYPDIGSECGEARWRNGGGLFRQYGRPAEGIGTNYICHLLAPGDVPEDYNRNHFAGFTPYAGYGKPALPPLPGTMKLRGRDLGEMTIKLESNPDWPDIKVCGNESPSRSERDAIKTLVVPHLQKYISEHAAELRAEAVAKITANMVQRIADARKRLDVLEKEADEAIALLHK